MSNVAKLALKQFIDDGHYIQVVEEVDYLPVYKGKDFGKAWTTPLIPYIDSVKEDYFAVRPAPRAFDHPSFVFVLVECYALPGRNKMFRFGNQPQPQLISVVSGPIFDVEAGCRLDVPHIGLLLSGAQYTVYMEAWMALTCQLFRLFRHCFVLFCFVSVRQRGCHINI